MRYWTTKNGKKISFKKLTNIHLLNIIKFIEKRAKELNGEIISGGCDIDGKPDWWEEGTEKDWLWLFQHEALKEEARSRGLLKNNNNLTK